MLNRLIHAAFFTVALSVIATDYAPQSAQNTQFQEAQSLPRKLFQADLPKLPLWFNLARSVD
jgi:predicted nicotinamide N-methyase